MVDFSSVNLRILSPDGKSVLAELQTIDRAGQRVSRNVAGAGRAAIEDFSQHAALTSRRVAGELSMIAHEGAISARSLKSVAIEASNAAFAFGSTGIIAGAVALTGIAIFNLFSRTRDEIRATNRVAMEEIERLAKAGSIGGVASRAQELFSGQRFAVQGTDESDVAFQARQLGMQGVRAKISDIKEKFSASSQLAGALGESARTLAHNEIQPWSEELDKLTKQHERLIGLLGELNVKESDMASRHVADLRAQGAKERSEKLDELLRDNQHLGVPGITGKPMAFFNPAEFGPAMLKGIQDSLKKTPAIPITEMTPELERIAALDKVAESVGDSFGHTLAESITAGITSAVSGGGLIGGFRAMTGALLSGIGQMFIQLGTAALVGLIHMKAIKDAISKFLPELGIPGAIALIGLGAVLTSAGAGMSHGGGGRSGGSNYGYGGGTTTYVGTIYPSGPGPNMTGIQPTRPITVNATFFGPRDPKLQREFLELVKLAGARGNV